ncbi:hypothetical protein EST38_g5628 [Candolleomyces aberdarensis]|uniref:NAD(P)-binding domain-containing protein n=1 Tax=Candolleomyces aberdarensis TaxID=2316362 RepID=A0A4Q2DJV6_9AGAR|nr:hypothetical protein EST38_g5628 [Candolleomyces aberdarensis]
MTTFITGGASQIGLGLARRLHQADRSILFGSRAGRGTDGFAWVPFDWDDASTFENAFKRQDIKPVESVYILPAVAIDPLPKVAPFIDLAIEKGVKRFVVISAADCPKGGPEMGAVHGYLEKVVLKKRGLIDYVALRPTWFTDNLSREQYTHIKEHDEVVTPLHKARVPFIAVEDIAQAAFEAIVHEGVIDPEDKANSEPILIGPNLVSYDEVAQILSTVLGRPIKHRTISRDEALAQYISYGFPEASAKIVVEVELSLDKGSAERLMTDDEFAVVRKVGKVGVQEYVEKNKGIWLK